MNSKAIIGIGIGVGAIVILWVSTALIWNLPAPAAAQASSQPTNAASTLINQQVTVNRLLKDPNGTPLPDGDPPGEAPSNSPGSSPADGGPNRDSPANPTVSPRRPNSIEKWDYLADNKPIPINVQ